MKKYYGLFVCIFLCFWFASADSITLSWITTNISTIKNSLITTLETANKDSLSKITLLSKKLTQEMDYAILDNLNNFKLSELSWSLMSTYFDNKTLLLSDYNTIYSKILVLWEKKSYNLITDAEYSTQLIALSSEVDWFNQKYKSLVDTFSKTYSGQVAQIETNYSALRLEKKDLLTSIKNNKAKLDELLSKNTEYTNLVDKINLLYIWKYDTIQAFVEQLKASTSVLLRDQLTEKYDNALSSYEKFSYYSKEITSYIDSLINSYTTNLDKKFQDLVKWFYTKDDNDFIISNVSSLKLAFYSGDAVNYKALSGSAIDTYYSKLKTKLDSGISNINTKLANVNNAQDLNTLQDSLKKEIQSFFNLQQSWSLASMDNFLKEKKQLLWYKLWDEIKYKERIQADFARINSLTWTDQSKYVSIELVQKTYKDIISNIIDPSIKADMQKSYWALEVKKIDLLIKINVLSSYALKYPRIDFTVAQVLTSLNTSATTSGKTIIFSQKLDSAMTKIDELLKDTKLAKNNKYLLLNIKKAIITFKYLK